MKQKCTYIICIGKRAFWFQLKVKHQGGVPGRVPIARQAQGAPQTALKQVPEGALETRLVYPSNSNSNFNH